MSKSVKEPMEVHRNWTYHMCKHTKQIRIIHSDQPVDEEKGIYRAWILAKKGAVEALREEIDKLTKAHKYALIEAIKLKSPKYYERLKSKKEGKIARKVKSKVTKTAGNSQPVKITLR